MNKINLRISICCILGGLFFAGCVESNKLKYVDVNVAQSDLNVVSIPLVIDFDNASFTRIVDTVTFQVERRIRTKMHPVQSSTYYAKDTIYELPYDLDNKVDEYKKLAFEKCVSKHGCDVIVNVMYDVFLSDDNKFINVVVRGFSANYKRIRSATPEDVWIINFQNQGDYIRYIDTDMDTI